MDDTKAGFCSSCGKETKIEDRFCNNCGYALKEIAIDEQPEVKPIETKIVTSDSVIVHRTEAGLQQKVIKVKKKVLGRNALILTIMATISFIVPCFGVNMTGFAFALASTIVGIFGVKRQEQKTLSIICIVINTVFSILSVLARTVWNLGFVYI